MPQVNLPDEPTPEVLGAIKRAMFAPLTGITREGVIYRAIVRATADAATRTIWHVEGGGRVEEPTSQTITANSEGDIGKAVTELLADGFPRVEVRSEQVQA